MTIENVVHLVPRSPPPSPSKPRRRTPLDRAVDCCCTLINSLPDLADEGPDALQSLGEGLLMAAREEEEMTMGQRDLAAAIAAALLRESVEMRLDVGGDDEPTNTRA